MKESIRELMMFWKGLKPLQKKGGILALLGLSTLFFIFFHFKSDAASYAPLFPGKTLSSSEWSEIRAYLNHFSIPFEEKKEKGIFVLAEHVDQIRAELSDSGFAKKESGKGFELFDTNTWIKGEKELQVLEMRALKGQLEKDLTAFEQIKSANVILDIPPQKSFSGSKYQTKASVILTLMPKTRLTPTQLHAITNHLSGAVRGLEPHMIAISDTTGKLYKAINSENGTDHTIGTNLLIEERLEEKISDLLSRLVGEDRFYARVQTIPSGESDKISGISIAVVIDKRLLLEVDDSFQREIERQLETLAKCYGVASEIVVDFIPFERERKKEIQPPEKRGHVGYYLGGLFLLIMALSFPLFFRRKKKGRGEEEALFRVMTRVDIQKLASSIEKEDPHTIAIMLSYLEPSRAEEMISSLSHEVQEEVLYHLSEMEREGR